MKIFGIGRNYADHAAEMKSDVPQSPVVFLMPPSALLMDNKPFYYPEFSNDVHYEAEVVIKVVKNGKHVQLEFAHQYYDEFTLGIDFTARDLQWECKKKGLPWAMAKGFDNSAGLGTFQTFGDKGRNISFSLRKNDEMVQEGNTREMIFSFDDIIVHLSKYFKLLKGDLIYTGTPSGVGPLKIGDILSGYIEDEQVLHCEIK